MLFLTQRGFSTIELMITLGFLGAVVYGGISVLEKQKSNIIRANQEIQMTTLTHELRKVLQKRAQCQRSFQGLKPNTSKEEVSSFYQRRPTSMAPNTWVKVYGNEDIQKITEGPAQLSLASYGLSHSDPEVGPEDQTTELIIRFDRGPIFKQSERYPTKKIKIFYELNSDQTIRTCALTPLQQESPYWELDYTYGQLTYKGQALGVSQNSPEADLDIKGPLLIHPIHQKPGLEECGPETQGLLISQGSRRRLFYCDSRQWRLLAP